jgi:gliding motility-associated-like protein
VSEGSFSPSSGGVGGPYTISYTYTDSIGCSNSSSLPVTIFAAPNVIVTSNPNICLGNSDSLIASGGLSYAWSPTSGLSCSSCGSTVANPTATTTYIVDASNASCSASDTVVVHVFSISVNAGPNQHILYGSTAQLDASPAGIYSYVWSPGNTLNNDSISDPIASPTVTTTYVVTGRDSLGCISTDSLVIFVSNPCESLMLPSGFTPDGSDNRYFHVLNLGAGELQEFKVFNRWGQMVYETTDINDRGWDGTFNGKPQPMGTYVYYTELLCQGQTVFIKGNITLIR